MAESSVAAMQRRLISNLTKTAEERYEEFEKNTLPSLSVFLSTPWPLSWA
ncbi:hypothetical protein [Chryseobacterium wanjuense]